MSAYLSAARNFLRSHKRIICIMAPVILGLLYMVLCMAQLRQSIWFDESYSAYLTHFDYPKVWDLTAQDATSVSGGYLLRTKIRAAIEFFDQLYQYGEAGKTKITELGKETFEEDDTPELPELDDL